MSHSENLRNIEDIIKSANKEELSSIFDIFRAMNIHAYQGYKIGEISKEIYMMARAELHDKFTENGK